MAFYPWVVIAHVVFVILAFGAHGVSAFAMFRVKRETDRARIGAVLDLSTMALVVSGVGLVVAVLLGIVAAAMAGYFGLWWPWLAIVVVIVVWFAMTPVAARPMNRVRQALGLPTRNDAKGSTPVPGTDAELAAAQASIRPELVAVIGVTAIVVLVWLMEAKPF